MAANFAFQPMGKTYLLACSNTSANVQVTADSPSNQMYIHNSGAVDAFVNVGNSNAVAAAVPDSGGKYGFVVPAGGGRVFSTRQGGAFSTLYVAGILGSATTANLYITCGEGF